MKKIKIGRILKLPETIQECGDLFCSGCVLYNYYPGEVCGYSKMLEDVVEDE